MVGAQENNFPLCPSSQAQPSCLAQSLCLPTKNPIQPLPPYQIIFVHLLTQSKSKSTNKPDQMGPHGPRPSTQNQTRQGLHGPRPLTQNQTQWVYMDLDPQVRTRLDGSTWTQTLKLELDSMGLKSFFIGSRQQLRYQVQIRFRGQRFQGIRSEFQGSKIGFALNPKINMSHKPETLKL